MPKWTPKRSTNNENTKKMHATIMPKFGVAKKSILGDPLTGLGAGQGGGGLTLGHIWLTSSLI